MSEKLHRDCEVHESANCDINDHKGLEPITDDCGHYVNAGPGTKNVGDLNMYNTDKGKKAIVAGVPKHNLDQDVNNGPGKANVGDLNSYEEKNGRKVVVAGMPDHNMDQDINNGPGVK